MMQDGSEIEQSGRVHSFHRPPGRYTLRVGRAGEEDWGNYSCVLVGPEEDGREGKREVDHVQLRAGGA